MMTVVRAALAVCMLAACASASLVNVEATRHVDLTNHLATVRTELKVKNTGSGAAGEYQIKADPLIKGRLALTTIQVGSGDIAPVTGQSAKVSIKAGETATLEVVQIYTHAQEPFPEFLGQQDTQLVRFFASLHVPTPYETESQTTILTLAGKTESYSKVKPYKADGTKLTYGPYKNVAAGSEDELKVHFENSTPFLTATTYEREIMVSHWGYSTITETTELVHSGGKLKGTFSRLDYQRNPQARKNGIETFTTRLPAAASDVYYRDVIGNISTSNLREEDDAVLVEIQPRFPLFGGWKTHYTLGYTMPTYEVLFTSSKGFHVNMRFLSHIYDNFVIDDAVIKVVLPEGATDIEVDAPFAVERSESTLVTYFDTAGRPVVELRKSDLVEEHMQDFTVTYQFPTTSLVREPLMAVAFFGVLFVAAILLNRIDLSVSPEEKAKAE